MQEPLLKIADELILPPSLGPPSQVSQVEIEAGDSEGRLPLVMFGLRPSDFGFCGSQFVPDACGVKYRFRL